MTDPLAEYERRLAAWRERIAALDRINFTLSNVRLAIALTGVVLLWMAFVRGSISPAWPLGAWLSFGILAAVHAKRLQGFERAKAAERVYLRGLDRLAGRWAGAGRGGAPFLDGHPYAGDLDLFGPASLFELLNTTRTEVGELTLADWLRAPAVLPEVRARQAAVDELRPMLDFKEDVAVLASESPVGRTGPLATWAASPPVRFAPALRLALAASALITIALALVVYRDLIAPEWLFGWLFLELGGAALWGRVFHRVLHAIETPEHDLALLAGVLARLESQRFSSPRLAALHDALMTDGVPPSTRIAHLRTLVSWLDSTHNHDVRADRRRPASAPAARDRHRSLARSVWTGGRRLAARGRRRRGAGARSPPTPTSIRTIRFPNLSTPGRSSRRKGSATR